MYQALYRKYRPQVFDDVVGQMHITRTLKNQLANGRLSHAYLFTGSRGTGKTTCAKILAKAVNCENPSNGNPCNCCSACKSIDSGACMDVLEIDAASNNGVDNVRSLRDEAIYSPAEVQKRVYIIDEVHMLSMSAFNALLKIIEEPPAHVLFILATTELHKVPVTILSRCQRFAFRRILPEDIVGRLNEIAYREKVELEQDAAAFLARLADGGLRDAVSMLDQCASAAGGEITTEEVCRVLGLAGTRKAAELMLAVSAHDTPKALSIFNAQYAEGKDLSAMLDELCTVCRDLLMLRTAPKSVSMLSGICTEKELQELLPKFSAGELLRLTSLLRAAATGFAGSANRRIDAELCIIRMCETDAQLDAESIGARLSRLENKIASGMIAAPVKQEKAADDVPPWEEMPPTYDDDDAPYVFDDSDAPPIKDEPLPPAPQKSDFWAKLVERLRSVLTMPARSMFVNSDSAPVRGNLTGDRLNLQGIEFAVSVINKPEILQTVAECAAAILGRPIQVSIGTQGDETPVETKNFTRLMDFGEQHPEIVEFK